MSTTLLIYFWGIADKVQDVTRTVTILSGAAFVILTIIRTMGIMDDLLSQEQQRSCASLSKKAFTMFIVAGSLFAITPSSGTVAMLAIVPKILESNVIQNDLPEVYDAAKKALLEKLK